ncbi:HIT domain-containing protein [Terricaulis sp.]|uniref:HIT domain-containing protein n=1 Tax=Terricaulis sp. TaxID=2768686 RepID=UPI0037845900
MDFDLHPRLAATGIAVCDLALSRVILKDDRRWPWLILVPRRTGLSELHQLAQSDATVLMDEMQRASAAVATRASVVKVNLGALGNEVPQLHVHVVGRWPGDPAWPGPVWGVGGKEAYAPSALKDMADTLRAAIHA